MKKLEVRFHTTPNAFRVVGTLAESAQGVFFEYAPSFLEDPLWLSPFKLKPQPGAIKHNDLNFGPLFGLFDDSLPDGWGLLLMDRYLTQKGILPSTISPLDRLAFLGDRTMGALTYFPPKEESPPDQTLLDLHRLSQESKEVLQGSSAELLPELFRLGGSPGGARPKILASINEDTIISGREELPAGYQPWLIKFHSNTDADDSGAVEFAYAKMAEEAGLIIPDTRLFETKEGDRFFGIERFDRQNNTRIHIHSFGNLIHANFRIPSCDYEQFLKVTEILTKDSQDVAQSFRRMLFNIASHNRDDHVKNFAFRFHHEERRWNLAPAFDLTFAEGPGGEHSMTVNGEGQAPTRQHVLALARNVSISPKEAETMLEEVCEGVSQWKKFASSLGIAKKRIEHIAQTIEKNIRQLRS